MDCDDSDLGDAVQTYPRGTVRSGQVDLEVFDTAVANQERTYVEVGGFFKQGTNSPGRGRFSPAADIVYRLERQTSGAEETTLERRRRSIMA
ncbi:hypothetical protein NDU88_001746 [Pleurodeles waltl]|uniref:Uncharacterized protein n=1 Tax=Pleurodeles waltl TaxID=8319 RepID=A0AAV7RB83_PLEWA|nr:hypothetical protein NDU88_001746 [Pleurodeles waltl]